jgi:hypothetical protein
MNYLLILLGLRKIAQIEIYKESFPYIPDFINFMNKFKIPYILEDGANSRWKRIIIYNKKTFNLDTLNTTYGINWTGGIITGTTAGVEFRGVICGQSLWVIVGTTGISPRGYWAINPTSTWTAGTGFAGGAVSRLNSISFGIYPVSSIAAGTTYGTIFCVGGLTASSSSSGYVYSTDGKTWTTSASGNTAFNNQQLNSLTWNGKRFIGIAGTTATNTRIAYSYDAQTWYTTGITPTSSQLFTTAGYGVASSAWPTLGSVYVDNALALSSTSGVNTINKLDIYSDTYFNNGYNNAEFNVKSTQL